MERKDERKAVCERTLGFPLDAHTKIKHRKVESTILFTVLSNILQNEFSRNNLLCSCFISLLYVYRQLTLHLGFFPFLGVFLHYRMSFFKGCYEKMGKDIIKPC